MNNTLIKSVHVVNNNSIKTLDVLIQNERIYKIDNAISVDYSKTKIVNSEGLYLLPGLIDDQVHFREPGYPLKGTIYSESKAAIAGGITSFMDMPNTQPNTTDLNKLEEKYELAKNTSLANYSFFMGITKHNLEEALKIDNTLVCGLSDDGLYFDDEEGILANYPDHLEKLFSRTNSLVALHCEDDSIIHHNFLKYKKQFNDDIPIAYHPIIRSEDACFEATKRVIGIAEKHNTRLHVFHVSTKRETELFKEIPILRNKRITGEACVHHIWFTDKDYEVLGAKIKWNPAIKTEKDRSGLISALKHNKLDIIATDHAPHLLSEKNGVYSESKSGAPLVQHALVTLLELYHQNQISLEQIVEKTSHNVSEIYRIPDRGYLREGYYADLVLVDLNSSWTSNTMNSLYKCGWSPFDNYTFKSKVIQTYVNGHLVYDNGRFNEQIKGKRLLFEKDR